MSCIRRANKHGSETRSDKPAGGRHSLPQREADLRRHDTLSDDDLQHIGARRRPLSKLGFALQLCVLRSPSRLLAPGEFVELRQNGLAERMAARRCEQRLALRAFVPEALRDLTQLQTDLPWDQLANPGIERLDRFGGDSAAFSHAVQ